MGDKHFLEGNIGDTTYQFSLNGTDFAVGGELSSEYIDNCIFIRDEQGLDTFDFSRLRVGAVIDINQFGGESYIPSLDGDTPEAKIVCDSLIEKVIGTRADDTIYGNDFANTISGGRGGDDIWGAQGADIFIYNGLRSSTVLHHDTIEDFETGQDFINLKNVDADSTKAGKQHFHFIGGHSFSHEAGELRFHNGHLLGDTNGDGHADFRIDIVGDLARADLLGVH